MNEKIIQIAMAMTTVNDQPVQKVMCLGEDGNIYELSAGKLRLVVSNEDKRS